MNDIYIHISVYVSTASTVQLGCHDNTFTCYFLRSHAIELGNPVPEEPLLFLKPVSSYVEIGNPIEVYVFVMHDNFHSSDGSDQLLRFFNHYVIKLMSYVIIHSILVS